MNRICEVHFGVSLPNLWSSYAPTTSQVGSHVVIRCARYVFCVCHKVVPAQVKRIRLLQIPILCSHCYIIHANQNLFDVLEATASFISMVFLTDLRISIPQKLRARGDFGRFKEHMITTCMRLVHSRGMRSLGCRSLLWSHTHATDRSSRPMM